MQFTPLTDFKEDKNTENRLSSALYSKAEIQVLRNLESLFQDWQKTFENAADTKGFIVRDFKPEHMSFDGFYPGYLAQKVKILFIGREGRGLSGFNYLASLYPAFKSGVIAETPINRHLFCRRLLYVTYSLTTGEREYTKIPYADSLIEQFGTSALSFAFMNISKFSNDKSAFQSDYETIDKAVEISVRQRNFILEEIDILNPDLVISMNLLDRYGHTFGDLSQSAYSDSGNKIKLYTMPIGKRKVPLIDSYHFSYARSERLNFIEPIFDAGAAANVVANIQ